MLSNQVWIAHLRAHAAVACAGVDPEGVHQVRVAASRLASWVELAGRRLLLDDLRWIRRGAARARDLDVLLVGVELQPARHAWFASEREREQAGLAERLGSSRFRALCTALELATPPDPEDARTILARLERRALRAGDGIAASEDRIASLHRARRRLRRLRYAREWLGLETRVLQRVQDAFGALNDRQGLLRALEEAPFAGDTKGWRAEIARELEEAIVGVVQRWDVLRADVARS